MLIISILVMAFKVVFATNLDTFDCGFDVPILETIPGRGYDGLTSETRGQISETKFDKCINMPNSDSTYKVPEIARITAVDKLKLEVNIITDWTKYSPIDASKMTSVKTWDESKFQRQIDGSFSADYSRVKRKLLDHNEATVRVMLVYHLLTIDINKKTSLSSEFKDGIQNVIDQYQNDDIFRARFYADKIVQEFGTYFVTKVHVGGIYVEESYFDISNLSNFKLIKLEFDAKRAFLCTHDIELDELNSTNCDTYFDEKRNNSGPKRIGGLPDLDVRRWIESVAENVAVINQFGVQLHRVEIEKWFPQTKNLNIAKVIKLVQEAVQKYYRLNTHLGCARPPNSDTFDNTVNLHDPYLCEGHFKERRIGGFYQKCISPPTDRKSCVKYEYPNCYWNRLSRCPPRYTDEPLVLNDCLRCPNRITSHFCSTDDQSVATDQVFGGLFSPYVNNVLTNSTECPDGHFVSTLGEDLLYVCISNEKKKSDISIGAIRVICKHRKMSMQPCPTRYTLHFATLIGDCEVYYCLYLKGNKKYKYKMDLMSPPYSQYSIRKIDTRFDCLKLDAVNVNISMFLTIGNLFIYLLYHI